MKRYRPPANAAMRQHDCLGSRHYALELPRRLAATGARQLTLLAMAALIYAASISGRREAASGADFDMA